MVLFKTATILSLVSFEVRIFSFPIEWNFLCKQYTVKIHRDTLTNYMDISIQDFAVWLESTECLLVSILPGKSRRW